METLQMTKKEADQLCIIQQAVERKISIREAGQRMRLSQRQIKRKVKRIRREGPRGIIHKLRGRQSNNRLKEEKRQAIRTFLTTEKHTDFSAPFAAEKLEEQAGIQVSVSTIWKMQIEAGIRTKRRRQKRHRAWRERRASVGELVQIDGSHHAWLEERGPQFVLITIIDDATSRILHSEFAEHEDTRTLMQVTQAYIRKHGRPEAIYVDKDSIYKVNREASIEEQLREVDGQTQYARAMEELGIEIIYAHSPQAKGRVERSFGVEQDRLVKELRLRDIQNIAEANRYLQREYVPQRNRKFGKTPARPEDAHRKVGRSYNLKEIFSIRTERTVANDYTIRYKNQYYQLAAKQGVLIRPRNKVEVEERLDGTMHIRKKGEYLQYKALVPRNERKPIPAVMSGKELERRREWKPAADHPWRNGGPRTDASLATLPAHPCAQSKGG